MKTQHTTGPWIVNPSAFNNTIHAMGDSEPLATCHVSTDMHGKGRDGITMLQANARLIAAAPDLLAALEWCEATYGAEWPDNAAIRETIKKARGE